MNRRVRLFLCLALAVQASLLLSACARVAGVSATPTHTIIPPTRPLAPTATPLPTSTPTPLPTATHTPSPVPSPTKDKTATQAAKLAATEEALQAVALPFLEKNGIDPASGRVVYYSKAAVRTELTGYTETTNYVLKDVGVVTDFVMQTKIRWNTTGGLALCGVTFRAEEDLDKGKQYRFFMMRLQYDPGWTIWFWNKGQFENYVSNRWLSSRDIHDDNDSSNTVTLVARGKDMDIYLNGDKQRRVEDTRLKEGLLALSGFQESGRTECQFTDTWVWTYDQ